MTAVHPYPDWLEFHARTIGGPVVSIRSRSGIVRLEDGQGEVAERVHVGIPDDDAWSALARALETGDFWRWSADTRHHEPHKPGDWYWWLEVRDKGRRHRAAAWNDAPEGFERVRDALFELVGQVVAEVPV
jgi:hypothetical protein